ncbi:MAG: aminodeoxychorismate synthase component I [Pseudomonadota bacterium]
MTYRVALPYFADAGRYYAALRDLPWPVWLDSGGRDRYDILTADPVRTWETRSATTCVRDAAGEQHTPDDPFELLREALGEKSAPLGDLPFAGGLLGYWGYDLARRWIDLPHIAADAEHLPEMAVGLYDWAVVLDHQTCAAWLVSHLRDSQTLARLPNILACLLAAPQTIVPPTFRVTGAVQANFSSDRYAVAFNAVQRYLHDGDCYQVNLAQRFEAPAEGDAFAAYLALRRISPAPFAAFLDLPDAQILSASPERFLRVQKGQVETKPIKGTRPRGFDPAQDAALIEDLRSHPKDRAENLMIVDLLRNDLGKTCAPGSVRTPKLFEVESYANVHHLVSTVTGRLAPGKDALHLLRDCFPGGSITGAPKRRAMEIIEQLEPHRRGVYCGAIGYMGFDGNMDTNIAIRTLVYAQGSIRCWAGGGIVADSEESAEYQETLDKASAMLKVMRTSATRSSPA